MNLRPAVPLNLLIYGHLPATAIRLWKIDLEFMVFIILDIYCFGWICDLYIHFGQAFQDLKIILLLYIHIDRVIGAFYNIYNFKIEPVVAKRLEMGSIELYPVV